MEGVPRRTLRHWLDDAEKINSFDGPDTRKSIGRSGRREILPFGRELSAFLEEGRREGREMTSSHMIEYIRQNHAQWLESYLADKKSAESGQAALVRLCQRFVERHGFTQSTIGTSLMRSNTTTSTTSAATATSSTEPQLRSSMPATTQPDISNSYEYEADDDSPLLFGLDIGTTAIKCVLVKADGGQTVAMTNVSLSDVVMPTRPGEEVVENKIGVQNVDQILLAVQRAVNLLPEAARQRITSIGICGQMHGIVWWCSRAVHETAERLLATGANWIREDDDTYEPGWSELITWQDQRCTPSFLENCRKRLLALKLQTIPYHQAGLLLVTDLLHSHTRWKLAAHISGYGCLWNDT